MSKVKLLPLFFLLVILGFMVGCQKQLPKSAFESHSTVLAESLMSKEFISQASLNLSDGTKLEFSLKSFPEYGYISLAVKGSGSLEGEDIDYFPISFSRNLKDSAPIMVAEGVWVKVVFDGHKAVITQVPSETTVENVSFGSTTTFFVFEELSFLSGDDIALSAENHSWELASSQNGEAILFDGSVFYLQWSSMSFYGGPAGSFALVEGDEKTDFFVQRFGDNGNYYYYYYVYVTRKI